MNNLIGMMMQGMRGGANPLNMLQGMVQQNPAIAPVLSIVQGKNPAQLEQTARNMARERGIDLDALAGQLGLK